MRPDLLDESEELRHARGHLMSALGPAWLWRDETAIRPEEAIRPSWTISHPSGLWFLVHDREIPRLDVAALVEQLRQRLDTRTIGRFWLPSQYADIGREPR